MLNLVAKVLDFKVSWWDNVLWYGALIPVAIFAVWYFLTASDPENKSNVPWAKSHFFKRFVYKDGGIIIPYLVVLFVWPIMAALANLTKIPAGWRMVIGITLMAMVINEVFRNVNKPKEYVPIILVMIVDWLALSAATFDACAGGRETIAEKGWPNFWQLALGFLPFIVALLAIGCIVANVLFAKEKKRWWLPKLIAAILAIIWLIILAIWLGVLKAKAEGNGNGNGDTSTPSVTTEVTATPTPTQAADSGITDKDREEIQRIMTAGDAQLDIILREYDMHIGMKVNKNSFPEKLVSKERLFEDGISVPFKADEKHPYDMVKEFDAEWSNPVLLRAVAEYQTTISQLSEFTWMSKYIYLYDTYGIEYFLESDGETLTTEYLMYAAIEAYLHTVITEAKVIEIPGTVTVWRLAKGDILSYEDMGDLGEHVVLDLGVARKDGYNELPQYRKVLVLHHGNKDAGYDEYINVFDKAPLIPMEETKPKNTPTPTPKKPSPTPTQKLTPSPTPTQKLTPSPTPTQKLTPTPTPTEQVTPTPTNTPTPTLTPTPTPSNTPTPTVVPKDPGQSSTSTGDNSNKNKPEAPGESFSGVTATPTPKKEATPTPKAEATPTPTPMKSSKAEPNDSTNDDLDTSKKVFEEANNEPTVKPTPQVTEVEDCEHPGSTKKVPGQVDDNLEKDEQANKKAATPTPTLKLAQTEDGNTISDTPSGSWGRSGR